jgi:hypothetical protein
VCAVNSLRGNLITNKSLNITRRKDLTSGGAQTNKRKKYIRKGEKKKEINRSQKWKFLKRGVRLSLIAGDPFFADDLFWIRFNDSSFRVTRRGGGGYIYSLYI